ncbi:MAG: hypothetical protein L0211_18490 [Planctomycetaceae bacterium]|nr:hypothetical protein [Planctomycetaceae bacterium]
MITSDKELALVQEQIADLNTRLRALFNCTDLTRFEVHLTAAGYDRMIDRLQKEVDAYEAQCAAIATPRS